MQALYVFWNQNDDSKLSFKKGSAYAAGYDLQTAEDITLEPGVVTEVKTGLHMAIPKGWYGKVLERSGLAKNHYIAVKAGVIDADYRGEIKILLKNEQQGPSAKPVVFRTGDRVAQVVFHQCGTPSEIVSAASFDEFLSISAASSSDRGSNGFGSTGVSHMV